MRDRRTEPRLLCADLVEVSWRDASGKRHSVVANLEDISLSGACLQLDEPLPVNLHVKINYPQGEFSGALRYCIFREIGYFLGVQFEPSVKWTQQKFIPQHLLDPRSLIPAEPAMGKEDAPAPN